MSESLVINRKEFQSYLNNLATISDNAILNVDSDKISCIVGAEDRSLFLWSVLEGDFDVNRALNIPSLRKFSKALNLISKDEVKLTINSNHIEYKGDIKFKYHLFDDGILQKPKITIAKIEALKYDTEFEVSKDFIKNLLKTSSVFNKTKKLYVFTDNGELWWSLADKTATNSDVFTVSSGAVDFELDDFILNLDNVPLLSFGSQNKLEVKINPMGIANFHAKSDNIILDYIATSLTK